MQTVAPKLSLEEFQDRYGHADRAYEYWNGEARSKGIPTWIHGLLQKIVMLVLDEAGFESAPEVELRIAREIHPRPDVIATRTQPVEEPYPSRALDVVVEIISEDDRISNIREHCHKYEEWGFTGIYLVDPSDRSVVQWRNGASIPVPELAGIPVQKIWAELDRRLRQPRE